MLAFEQLVNLCVMLSVTHTFNPGCTHDQSNRCNWVCDVLHTLGMYSRSWCPGLRVLFWCKFSKYIVLASRHIT